MIQEPLSLTKRNSNRRKFYTMRNINYLTPNNFGLRFTSLAINNWKNVDFHRALQINFEIRIDVNIWTFSVDFSSPFLNVSSARCFLGRLQETHFRKTQPKKFERLQLMQNQQWNRWCNKIRNIRIFLKAALKM